MRGGLASAGMRGAFMTRVPWRAAWRCLARSWAIIRFSSGRQEPQLVPARVACPISATVRRGAGRHGVADASFADAEAGADHGLGLDDGHGRDLRKRDAAVIVDVERGEVVHAQRLVRSARRRSAHPPRRQRWRRRDRCAGRDARRASRRPTACRRRSRATSSGRDRSRSGIRGRRRSRRVSTRWRSAARSADGVRTKPRIANVTGAIDAGVALASGWPE